MKIVILGYTGLIGKSILNYLAKNTSTNLICVGRNIKKKPFNNIRIKYFKWDFNSFRKSNLLFLKKADIIINCVGKTENSINNLEKINVIFLEKLLKYINSRKLKLRFIHLSSISVYGGVKNYFDRQKLVSENSPIKLNDLYSESKLKGDLLIQNLSKKNINNNFSYTILRITNVFGGKKKSNLFKFVIFSLRTGFWIKSYDDVVFNFVNVKDVTQAVILTISKLKYSKNKIYIVADDCKQLKIYENYQKLFNKKFIKVHIPLILLKLIYYFFPLPNKLLNFIFLTSSRVSYNNKKIKKDLNFKPRFSLLQNIKNLNE